MVVLLVRFNRSLCPGRRVKSELKFYDFDTKAPSSCGEVLEIEFSSADLDWPGIILEKGSAPHFFPKNVYTGYFYFALALEQNLHWYAKTANGMTELKTSPGEIWINPPSSPFSHDISEPCYFVILAVEEETFLENCALGLANKKLQFLNNYNVLDETIKGIIDLFLIEARAGGRNGYQYLKNLLALLSTHYIQNYSNFSDLINQHPATSKLDQKQVDKIDQYIDRNIGSKISVEDLADLLRCSKFYFLREFKKFVGITPYQYLLNKRLEQARMLLSAPQNTISSVGFDLGFNDQSHFTKAFKNQFGLTPKQFQEQTRENV